MQSQASPLFPTASTHVQVTQMAAHAGEYDVHTGSAPDSIWRLGIRYSYAVQAVSRRRQPSNPPLPYNRWGTRGPGTPLKAQAGPTEDATLSSNTVINNP